MLMVSNGVTHEDLLVYQSIWCVHIYWTHKYLSGFLFNKTNFPVAISMWSGYCHLKMSVLFLIHIEWLLWGSYWNIVDFKSFYSLQQRSHAFNLYFYLHFRYWSSFFVQCSVLSVTILGSLNFNKWLFCCFNNSADGINNFANCCSSNNTEQKPHWWSGHQLKKKKKMELRSREKTNFSHSAAAG